MLTDILGLIQNADDHLIATVKDLVEHYIAQENTLIVIAMPMTGWFPRLMFARFRLTISQMITRICKRCALLEMITLILRGKGR